MQEGETRTKPWSRQASGDEETNLEESKLEAGDGFRGPSLSSNLRGKKLGFQSELVRWLWSGGIASRGISSSEVSSSGGSMEADEVAGFAGITSSRINHNPATSRWNHQSVPLAHLGAGGPISCHLRL